MSYSADYAKQLERDLIAARQNEADLRQRVQYLNDECIRLAALGAAVTPTPPNVCDCFDYPDCHHPVSSTPEAATERCEHVGCQHPMHFEAELQRAPEEQRE